MKYGTALPPSFVVPKSAFWIVSDLERRNPFEGVAVRPGDVVMDCGAYIGTFAVAAVEQGAACVTCYEAAPKNATMLRRNVANYPSIAVVEAALIASDSTSVELTLSGFDGAHSIVPSSNRKKSIRVQAVNFRAELIRLRPNVLKLDVEGAEYELLSALVPGDLASVGCIFIEFHPIDQRDEKIAAIRGFIESEGLQVVSPRRRAFTALRSKEAIL